MSVDFGGRCLSFGAQVSNFTNYGLVFWGVSEGLGVRRLNLKHQVT